MSIALIVLSRIFPRIFKFINLANIKYLTKESFPLWITTVTLYILTQVDLWIVGYFSNQRCCNIWSSLSSDHKYFYCHRSNLFSITANYVELNKKVKIKT